MNRILRTICWILVVAIVVLVAIALPADATTTSTTAEQGTNWTPIIIAAIATNLLLIGIALWSLTVLEDND